MTVYNHVRLLSLPEDNRLTRAVCHPDSVWIISRWGPPTTEGRWTLRVRRRMGGNKLQWLVL